LLTACAPQTGTRCSSSCAADTPLFLGTVVVLDLSTPASPGFVTYVTNRKLPRNATTGAFLACNDTNDCGDLGPEGLTFVPADQSPTGKALLLVSNEVSSTTTIWQVD
jgi:hypothetical protein